MMQKRHVATVTKVTPIKPTPTTLSGYTVETDCGHTFTGVPHVYFKVGSTSTCSTHSDDCECFYCKEKR